MTGESTVEILLVEDNPGDARYIRELLDDATELSRRAADRRDGGEGGVAGGKRRVETPSLTHESRLAPALDHLEDDAPDVVLLDLGLPDSDGLETLTRLLDRVETVPVVVLTGVRDREVGLEALSRGAEEFLVKDEINADLLVRSIYHAVERHARERELEQQREQLAALNNLNRVVQDITRAVVEQSTREEVERTVCEALATADSYEFAWIGGADSSGSVELRAEADTEGYLSDVTILTDADDPRGQGPTAQAIRTGEMQVVHDVQEDEQYEPWRDRAREYGFRSSAAIPVVHEGTLYGVLNVYADRPRAFSGEERELVGQLGEIVGHAIAAVERKRALMNDEMVELTFRIEDIGAAMGLDASLDGRITLDRTVPVGNGGYLMYGTATEDARDALDALVEAHSHWQERSTIARSGDRIRFELRLDEPPVLSSVAAHGGYVDEAALEDGSYHMRIHLPPGAAVRDVIDTVTEEYPTAEMLTRRQISRTDDSVRQLADVVREEFTDRQRAALEAAYYSGFFEWPRDSSGEEVAASLGVSAPTFHQHVRLAERKLLDALLSDATLT